MISGHGRITHMRIEVQRQLTQRAAAVAAAMKSTKPGMFRSRNTMTEESVEALRAREAETALEVATARRATELARFDVVEQLNQLDARKQLLLHDAVAGAVRAFSQFAVEANAVLAHRTVRLHAAEQQQDEAKAALAKDEAAWANARGALEAQLDGAVHATDTNHEPAALTVRLLSLSEGEKDGEGGNGELTRDHEARAQGAAFPIVQLRSRGRSVPRVS